MELEKLLQAWAVALIQTFKADISKKKLRDTEELINSFSFFLENNKDTAKIIIDFAVQGRFADMKTLAYTKMPPTKILEKWVKNNLTKFSNTGKPITQEQLVRRIAWGIAISRKAEGNVKNKKRWGYSKTLYSRFSNLQDAVFLQMRGYAQEKLFEMLNLQKI